MSETVFAERRMSKRQNAEEDYITTPISVLSYITDLESKLEEARYSATDYAMKLGRANEKLAEAREVIGNILNITYDSEGVAGYHDNGDVALWEEFEEIQQLEEQLKEQGKNE